MQLGWKGLIFTRLENVEKRSRKGSKEVSADAPSRAQPDSKGSSSRRLNDNKSEESNAQVATGKMGEEGEGSGADQAMETMQYDRLAIAYLSLLLLPLVVGFSLKKLVLDEHAGWYSWALQSLTVSKPLVGGC